MRSGKGLPRTVNKDSSRKDPARKPAPAAGPKAKPAPPPAPPPKPRYAVAAVLRDADGDHAPLGGLKWSLRKPGGPGAGGPSGTTAAPQALVEAPVPEEGDYTLAVTGDAEPRFPPPEAGKPLAELTVAARPEKHPAPPPTDLRVPLGARPKLVWANHEGKPVAKRRLLLVAPDGREVRAETDAEGKARLRLAAGAPALTVYAGKSEASRADCEADLAAVKAGGIAKVLDGYAEGAAAGAEIKLTRLHRSRIERALLPKAADVVKTIYGVDKEGEGGSIDTATCNVCAGISIAVLKALGYDAPVTNDAGVHVSVRVTPPGEPELWIDLSMPQFMRNGSAIDAALKTRGGWIGTDAELRAFCDEHIFDNNFHQAPSTPWSFYWASTLLQVQRTAESLRMLVLASDAKAALEKERATWRFDDPSDDVYGFRDGLKRDLWAQMDLKALPLGREAALGFQEQGIPAMREQALQVWKDGYEPGKGAVADMLLLWARGRPLKGNGVAAENLAAAYAAYAKGGAAQPGFAEIKALIERESDE